jgi:arylsulfatase A-like enzyme
LSFLSVLSIGSHFKTKERQMKRILLWLGVVLTMATAQAGISIVTGPTIQSDDASGNTVFSGVTVLAGDVVAISTAPNKNAVQNLLSLQWGGAEGVDGNSTTVQSADLNARACYVFYVQILNGGTYDFTVAAANSTLTAQSSLFVLRADSGLIEVASSRTLAQNTAMPGLAYTFSGPVSGGVAIESFASKVGKNLTVDAAYTLLQNGNGRFMMHSQTVAGTDWSKTHSCAEGAQDFVGAGAVFVEQSVAQQPPVFNSNPVAGNAAMENNAYTDSLASYASDPNGDSLSFWRAAAGPDWLGVGSNGDLTGTPGAGDLGINSWTVYVTDGISGTNSATLEVVVSVAVTNNRPNIVLFLADDLGFKDIVALRDPQTDGPTIFETPAMDQLASEGTVFTQAHCSGPRCVQSRVALMTGKDCFRPGLQSSGIAGSEWTMGEAMQAGGYRTCYAGKWHLGGGHEPEKEPYNQGFDVTIASGEAGAPSTYFAPYNLPAGYPSSPLASYSNGEYLTDTLTVEANNFITDHVQSSPSQPFFLTLAHYAVHTPLEAKPEDIAYFDNKLASTDFSNHPKWNERFGNDHTGRVRYWQDQTVYAAMWKNLDESLQSVRDHLTSLGIADNTIIIVTSDHGGKSVHRALDADDEGIPTANYPLRLGKGWVYEGGTRIPLIVYWPGVSAPGARCDSLISNTDFYTTLLDMGGNAHFPEAHLDSISFAGLVGNPTQEHTREHDWQHFSNAKSGTGNPSFSAYRKGDYKMIHHWVEDQYLLYDIKRDEGETSDQSLRRPDVLNELVAEYKTKRNALNLGTTTPTAGNYAITLDLLADIGGWDTTTLPDGTPGNLVANSVAGSAMQLTWDDTSSNEDGFVIKRVIAGGGGAKEIDRVGPNVTSYLDTGLDPDTSYKYEVSAYKVAGWTTSSLITATTLGAGDPLALVANDDYVTAIDGEVRVPHVLINDQGDGLSVVAATQPTNGAVTLVNGSIEYLCNPGFSGQDTFQYTVEDAYANSAVATVTVDVVAPAEPILPPLPSPTNVVAVAEDTYAKRADAGTGNTHGSESVLQVRMEGGSTFDRTSYLKFNVQSLSYPVASAKLYVYSTTCEAVVNALAISDTSWTESTLTWDNRPASGAVVGSGQAALNSWFVIDLTGYVTSNGTYAVALDEQSNVYKQLSSREGGNGAYLEIVVDQGSGGGNNAPVFTSNPVVEANAAENAAYSGTIADNATDADSDPLSFSKISGPSWLAVGSNGGLSGTPGAVDVGLNSWMVQVSDGTETNTATLEITVTPPKPNILFIAIDDINPVLGCYGDPLAITPRMDALAASGTTFLNAHCQWSVCGPSRASVMTGLMPEETGVMGFKKMRGDADVANQVNSVIRPNLVAIPQYFRYNGYRTTAVGKINDYRCVGSLNTATGKVADDGGTVDDPPSWGDPVNPYALPADFFTSSSFVDAASGWAPPGKPVAASTNLPDSAFTDGIACDEGIALLQNLATNDAPFFLGVGFKKPHLAFIAPQQYWDMYDRNNFSIHPFQEHPLHAVTYTWNYAKELESYDEFAIEGNSVTNIPESLQLEMIHGYYACVSFIDAQVGRLLDELEALGLASNTVVVLWGDHGFHLGDHAEWAKHTNLEQATRVPFIIRNPQGGLAGVKTDTPVALMDIYPTLCELAGLPIPEQPLNENEAPADPASGRSLKGKSLAGVVNGSSSSVRYGAVNLFKRSGAFGYAYRTERYRYTEWISGGAIVAREFYDYVSDPMETVNLAGEPGYEALMYQFSISMREEFDQMKLSSGDLAASVLQGAPAETLPADRQLPELDGKVSGGDVELSWPDAAGVFYNILFKSNLLDAAWTTNQVLLPGSPVSVPLPAEPQGFYRVEVAE